MPLDLKLVKLAAQAEAEIPCPPVHLATAAHLIIGRPVASRAFAEAGEGPLGDEIWHGITRDVKRQERKQAFDDALARFRPTWHALKDTPEDTPPTALTLFDVVIWAWGEPSGISVPTARVPLDAVTTWWFGAGEEIKAGGNTSFFVGAVFPVGE